MKQVITLSFVGGFRLLARYILSQELILLIILSTIACNKMLEILIEPKKSLLFWIIDLLADTARFKDINKVSVADLGMFLALSLLLSIYRFVFFVYHSTDIDPSFTPL